MSAVDQTHRQPAERGRRHEQHVASPRHHGWKR
jgi:hypothetical protein